MRPRLYATCKPATAAPRHGPEPLRWGARNAAARGGIVAAPNDPHRTAIGGHGGGYSVYRALAIASGALPSDHRPDLTDTAPADRIGPHPQWFDADKIVSLDPWGHLVGESFADRLARGEDIRPTIAITRARIDLPEIRTAIAAGRLRVDGTIVSRTAASASRRRRSIRSGICPGIARRFGLSERALRQALYVTPAGCIPTWWRARISRCFCRRSAAPPCMCSAIRRSSATGASRWRAGCTTNATAPTCSAPTSAPAGRIWCTASRSPSRWRRPAASDSIVYNRKEGRALGEVTKFMVYNARKRQPHGERPANYFDRTAGVAGVEDMRFQELMPDVLHWLGITHIDRFASMSNMKFDALAAPGHHGRRAGVAAGGSDPGGCPGRDRGQDRRRLFQPRAVADQRHDRPVAGRHEHRHDGGARPPVGAAFCCGDPAALPHGP